MHEAAALDIGEKKVLARGMREPAERRARMLFATIGGLVPGIKT
jgi:hypothetical protein